VWWFLRSINVIRTGELASLRAARRPPKPAPTMTTRGMFLSSIRLTERPTALLS